MTAGYVMFTRSSFGELSFHDTPRKCRVDQKPLGQSVALPTISTFVCANSLSTYPELNPILPLNSGQLFRLIDSSNNSKGYYLWTHVNSTALFLWKTSKFFEDTNDFFLLKKIDKTRANNIWLNIYFTRCSFPNLVQFDGIGYSKIWYWWRYVVSLISTC